MFFPIITSKKAYYKGFFWRWEMYASCLELLWILAVNYDKHMSSQGKLILNRERLLGKPTFSIKQQITSSDWNIVIDFLYWMSVKTDIGYQYLIENTIIMLHLFLIHCFSPLSHCFQNVYMHGSLSPWLFWIQLLHGKCVRNVYEWDPPSNIVRNYWMPPSLHSHKHIW